jgi:ribosome-associated protein
VADEATTPVDLDTGDLAVLAARAADDKQGERTVILQVGDLLGITEMFVISSASNVRLVRAVVQEVEHRLTIEAGRKPQRVEGLDDARWVLMDYGDWVVHVFLEEARAFYDLERLWADVPRLPWSPDA